LNLYETNYEIFDILLYYMSVIYIAIAKIMICNIKFNLPKVFFQLKKIAKLNKIDFNKTIEIAGLMQFDVIEVICSYL
jgi:hypothetical protein